MARTPKELMELTQAKRLELIESLAPAGKLLPTDAKDVNVLAMLLRDVDHTASTVLKLSLDEKAIDVASQTSKNVMEIIKQHRGADPFAVIEGECSRVPARRDVALPDPDLPPGVMDQGVQELVYEDFIRTSE